MSVTLILATSFALIAILQYLLDRDWQFSAFVSLFNGQVLTLQAIGAL